MDDRNARVIEEFRANEGRVGGFFGGSPMVILHSTGARSGRERVTPLVYLPDDGRVVVFATKGGAPENPGWYHNVVAHPEVTVEVGSETYAATATVAAGAERARLWAAQVARMPGFADYEQRTTRTIPVIVLQRR